MPADESPILTETRKLKPWKWSTPPKPLSERVFSKVLPEPNSGCWLWLGHVMPNGYGTMNTKRDGGSILAHRRSYEAFVGPIPEGMQLDHKCRVRCCVNPAHLEPVTPRENVVRSDSITAENSRKTNCKRGHPLSGENLYIQEGHGRSCVQCRRDADERRHERDRAARRAV